jgi:hypothetical protein
MRFLSARHMVALVLAGLVILYFAARPGRLPGALYWGCGTVCLLAASGELIARTRPNRSLLGFSSAWGMLVAALLVTGVGLVLLARPGHYVEEAARFRRTVRQHRGLGAPEFRRRTVTHYNEYFYSIQ